MTTAPPLFLFSPDNAEGLECWQIELPLPPKEASPNARIHWAQARGVTGKIHAYRDKCAELYREANLPKFKMPIVVHLDFYYFRGNPVDHPHLYRWRSRLKKWEFPFCVCHDEDNARASFKAGLDALQDAGIVGVDSRRSVRTGYCTIHSRAKEHRGRTCVVVTIQGERA